MKSLVMLVVVLVLAWMLLNYMDNKPQVASAPVVVEMPEAPLDPNAKPGEGRYRSPIQKANEVEDLLLEGADERRKQIEEQSQ